MKWGELGLWLAKQAFLRRKLKISVTETCENLFIDKMLVHSVKSADSAINEAMCFRKLVYHKNSERQGLEENAVHLEYVPILNYDVQKTGKSHSCVKVLPFSCDNTILL